MKQELTKLEKSYLMARMEIFIKNKTEDELAYLIQLVQSQTLLNPEIKYLSEVWGMLELALKSKGEVH